MKGFSCWLTAAAALMAAFAAGDEKAPAPLGPSLALYRQAATISFDSARSAADAAVEMEPLYGGKEWSVSCRWDDNRLADLKMRDVMEKHGYRGNWYLTAPRPNFGADVVRKLLEGGNGIGAHTMTHPYLTLVSRNRLFWEVAEARAVWESVSDRTICSMAFPFLAWRSVEGDAGYRDIATALARAGYYHVPHQRFTRGIRSSFEVSPLLPCDGRAVAEAAEKLLASARAREHQPHMSFCMHVWHSKPEEWARFEKQLDSYAHRPDWWYCNQSQYAAYRYQYHNTKTVDQKRDGDKLTLTIERPVLRELNDPVPLTFVVRGVRAEQVREISSPTARVERLDSPDGLCRFNLYHDRGRSLPVAIGLVENRDNHAEPGNADAAPDIPGLVGLLHFGDAKLMLTLRNRAAEPLCDVHITYRLPLCWKEGVVRRSVETIERDFSDSLALTARHADYKYTAGTAFYLAQVDFRRGGRPFRLHLSCYVPGPPRDPSCAGGGFAVLGPIPPEAYEKHCVEAAIRAGNILERLPACLAGRVPGWRAEKAAARAFLDPEVIATSGSWRNERKTARRYLLASTVRSPRKQQCGFLYDSRRGAVEAIFLNGEPVENGTATLEEGDNVLVVVNAQSGAWYEEGNAGCFLRLTRPGTRERLADVNFLSPLEAKR